MCVCVLYVSSGQLSISTDTNITINGISASYCVWSNIYRQLTQESHPRVEPLSVIRGKKQNQRNNNKQTNVSTVFPVHHFD